MGRRTWDMGCGNCGEGLFKISCKRSEGLDAYDEFTVECVACGNTSILRPSKPCMVVEWGKHSDGILAPIGQEE